MSASSVARLARTEVAPACEWYVDLDEYLGPQSNVSAAHTRCQGIVCTSLLDQVRIVASTDSTVLIEGETGAGKDVVAIRAASFEVPQIKDTENSYVDR